MLSLRKNYQSTNFRFKSLAIETYTFSTCSGKIFFYFWTINFSKKTTRSTSTTTATTTTSTTTTTKTKTRTIRIMSTSVKTFFWLDPVISRRRRHLGIFLIWKNPLIVLIIETIVFQGQYFIVGVVVAVVAVVVAFVSFFVNYRRMDFARTHIHI